MSRQEIGRYLLEKSCGENKKVGGQNKGKTRPCNYYQIVYNSKTIK